MDMFKTLPHSIIENILCLMPIKEAARTSILSKEWRYHWTKIPKLVLDEYAFESPNSVESPPCEERLRNFLSQREGNSYWCKLYYALYQILLKHEGPLHEVSLRLFADELCVEIEQILYYLSRNYSVKKLTLNLDWGCVLPLSNFSFHQLAELHLIECELSYQAVTFNVFDSLTDLYIVNLETSLTTLLNLLSSCPSLKSLTLLDDSQDYYNPKDYTVTNLFECLPTVEKLSICFSMIETFTKDGVPQAFPTKLIYLKCVHVIEMNFMYIHGLPFLLFLIRSAPNMEKLMLQVNSCHYFYCEDPILQSQKCSSTLEDCSNISLEHLKILEISDLSNMNREPELDFVKFIMSKSPVLKKVRISLEKPVHKADELQVSEVLLSSQSASSMVEIIVDNGV